VAAQTPGGTGALRIGGEFLKKEVGDTVAIPDPTWANHRGIFTACGMKLDIYPYYSLQTQKLEFKRFMQHLEALTTGTIVLLHACCHNPTGADLTLDQWKIVSDLFLAKGLIPFFDFAYQGLKEGIEEDATAIRLFAEAGHHMLVAYSLSKNFGLYAERTGGLFILTESADVAAKVLSKIKVSIRTNYSNPPLHGAAIATEILSNPQLKKEWQEELGHMRGRINHMRQLFCETLIQKSVKRDFRFLLEKSGMFCFTGLDKKEVTRLKEEFGIYMTQDGRMNLTGLNDANIGRVVDAILEVCKLDLLHN
jgi:aspartate/tyrosine/aromatic aminotransferase